MSLGQTVDWLVWAGLCHHDTPTHGATWCEKVTQSNTDATTA